MPDQGVESWRRGEAWDEDQAGRRIPDPGSRGAVHFPPMPDRNRNVTERRSAEPPALERVAEVAGRLERELAKAIVGQQR